MLKIHTSDGQTHKVDMFDQVQAKEWAARMRSRTFQSTITGISVVGSAGSRIKCPCCLRAGYLYCQQCHEQIPNDARTSVGVQYSMTKPDGYTGPTLFAIENIASDVDAGLRGGERVTCFAGDARIQMMVHAGQPSMRLSLSRTGHILQSPFFE